MADRPFTTILPIGVLRELARAAKEGGMKKKEIIIEAFTMWNKEREQALAIKKYNNTDSYKTGI